MKVPLRGSDVRRKFIGDEFQGRVVREVEGATLEISAGSVNFVSSKTLANSGFSKIQIEYFLAFSPAFLSKGFLSALETTRIAGGNRHGAISKWS